LGPITITKIRIDREKARLAKVATELGYENTQHMLHELYVVQNVSIAKISARLFTPYRTLYRTMLALGIKIKSRGGRNNVRTEITAELLAEIARDGVAAVAERLGVEPSTFSARLKRTKGEPNA